MSTPQRIPKAQEKQSTDLRDYQHIVVVFGTRYWEDRRVFHEEVMDLIESLDGEPLIFLSGGATTGADDLIIRWCKKFRYPFEIYEADWDKNGKAAGFLRNTEMAKVATRGLGFWDGKSNGTRQMIQELNYYEVSHKIIRIDELPDYPKRILPRPQKRYPNNGYVQQTERRAEVPQAHLR